MPLYPEDKEAEHIIYSRDLKQEIHTMHCVGYESHEIDPTTLKVSINNGNTWVFLKDIKSIKAS